MKRYLVLAEGYSADPHYGKTARGVMRYGADPVVAVVDSERPGESLDGVPVVATVEDALAYEPTTALVGVATAGGRLPEKWRDILKSALAAGLDLESGMHQFLGDDPELAELARRARRRDPRPAPGARRPERPDRREPEARRDRDPHGGLRLRDREDERLARARPGRARARPELGLRAHGPDGDRDRGLGDRRGRRRGGLHRGRGRAAGRRGRRPRRTSSGSKGRARSSIPTTRGSRSASSTGARRISSSSATRSETSTSRISRRIPSRRCPSSSSSTSGSRSPRGPQKWSHSP